jgi:hypothetical protein
MIILIVAFIFISSLISVSTEAKYAAEIAKINYILKIEEDRELLRKLGSLSPQQMDKFILDCEKWLGKSIN